MADTQSTRDGQAQARKWLAELKLCENQQRDWCERGRRIVKRYRDERTSIFDGARFNILWSNVETLLPATYARPPKAEVSRRNKDANPVARCAAQILERALQFEIDQYPDFDASVRQAVLDRLLPGRGTVWIRFEEYSIDRPAEEADAEEPTTEVANPLAMPGQPAEQERGEVRERGCVDYVFWEDFRTGQARTWADVPWVARREYLSRDEGVERFGEAFRNVPLTHEPIGIDDDMRSDGGLEDIKKAEVWEIWDRKGKRVYWVAKGYPETLDEKDDIYGLEGFFPCPKPLYATQTSDQLTPVPDFALYQDQANELDLLTTRIEGLTKALRLVGAYDASNDALARLLESADNTMVPVSNWANLSEKGGIGGVVSWVPLKEVVAALQAAYLAREQCKQVIYEITGISDIIRGATKASETATAQDIKRQFGSLRLQNRQRDVAVFCSEILRIKAQLMMDLYSPETLVAMSGIMDTPDGQYAPAAMELLQSEPMREYQISVAADSLVAIDEEQEKRERTEFLAAVASYLQQAIQASQTLPEIAPLLGELLMFGVRAYPAAKPVEAAFDQFIASLQQRPPQDPNAGAQAEIQARQQVEMAKLQAQMQQEQMKLQMQALAEQAKLQAEAQANQMRAQADMQVEQMRIQAQNQLEQARAQMQAEIDRYRAEVDAQSKGAIAVQQMEFDRWKAELDASVKIQVANISSNAKVENAATQTATDEIAREVQP